MCAVLFLFKHRLPYELRMSDWSSDVCSSDLTQVDTIGLDSVVREQIVGPLLRHGKAEAAQFGREAEIAPHRIARLIGIGISAADRHRSREGQIGRAHV